MECTTTEWEVSIRGDGHGEPYIIPFPCLDHVGCMQIYFKLSKSISMDKQVLKNYKDTIETIDLENKSTYLWSGCSGSISIDVRNSKVIMDLINTMIFRPVTLPCV